MRFMAILVAAGCLLAGRAAGAAENALDLLDAPVPYTGHFYVSSPAGTFDGTVWHQPGRERRDWATAGGSQAVLLDRTADAAYLLQPAGKWYVGIGLHAAAGLAGGLDGLTVERRRLGETTLDGMRVTHYRVTAPGRFDGEAWFSRDGIPVKVAGTLTQPDGRAAPVETGLTQVTVGQADPAMLTLPAGYFGMDLRSVPAAKLNQTVAGLKPLLQGRR